MVENSSGIFHLRWKISPLIFAFGENLPCFSPKGKNPLAEPTVIIASTLDKFPFSCHNLLPFSRYNPFKQAILLYPRFHPNRNLTLASEVEYQHKTAILSSFHYYIWSPTSDPPLKNRTKTELNSLYIWSLALCSTSGKSYQTTTKNPNKTRTSLSEPSPLAGIFSQFCQAFVVKFPCYNTISPPPLEISHDFSR